MKIAILSAMVEELEPILQSLENVEKIAYADNFYYKAKLNNHDLTLAYSKIGKVNSALTTASLIQKFGCEVLLFTGVAGSLNSDFKIKDLFFATTLAQHDLDITAFGHPFGYVPESKIFIDSDKNLNNLAKDVANNLGVYLKSGVIATGDQFICDDKKKAWIKETFKADAVEMEGASVALVCDALNIPFFILRSISDNSGGKAEIDFDEFLKEAAKISAKFILEMVKKI